MPFIVTPLQPATSVNNAAEGMFLPLMSDSNSKIPRGGHAASAVVANSQVILTTIDRILLYSCAKDSTTQQAATNPPLPPSRAHYYDPEAGLESGMEDMALTYTLLAEFRIYATILIAKAVPIVHPVTGILERHLLFLLTAKHQLILYAFARGASAGGAVSLIPIYAEDVEAGLYQPHYDGSILSAVTSYDVLMGVGSREPSDPATRNPPFVAVSIFHKNVFLVDVACCIFHGASVKGQDLAYRSSGIQHAVAEESTAEGTRLFLTAAAATTVAAEDIEGEAIRLSVDAKGKTSTSPPWQWTNRKPAIQALFSEEYWSTIVQARKDFTPVTPQFLDETTVLCLTFGHALHGCAQQFTLYVLHSARRSRVHLVEYTLRTEGKKLVTGDPATASDAIQLAIRGLGFHSKLGEVAVEWTPSGTVQSDLEMEARQVVALRDGLCVIGSQLVTYIRPRQPMTGGGGVASSGARKAPLVITEVIPWSSPQTPSEPKSSAVVQGPLNAFFVGFANGSIIGGRLFVPPFDADGSSDEVKLSVVHHDALLRLAPGERASTLDSLATVGPDTLVVGSLMGPSVVLRVGPPSFASTLAGTADARRTADSSIFSSSSSSSSIGITQTLLDNYGPVMDMTVVQEGSRTSIVASTGVEKQGGLFLLRSATTFHEAFRVPWIDGLTDVMLAHNVVCFSFPQQSRFLSFAASEDESTAGSAAVTLEELEDGMAATPGVAPSGFVFSEETLALCPLDDGCIVQVTPTLCLTVGPGDRGDARHTVRFPMRAARAAVMPARGLVIVSSGPTMGVFRLPAAGSGVGTAEALVVAEGEHEVACLCVTPTGWVVWGEWLSQSLTARHLDCWEQPVAVFAPAIPRSLCPMPFKSSDSITNEAADSSASRKRALLSRLGSAKREVVVAGLSDGAIAVLSLPPPPAPALSKHDDESDAPKIEFVLEETLRLSRHAVVVKPFLNGSTADAVLCCCDVPAMVHPRGDRLAVTGVALDEVDFAASCFHACRGPSLRSVVASRSGNFISFGCVWAEQRITRTAATQAVHKTVGRVCYLPHFRYLAASIRLRERDVVWFSSTHSAFNEEQTNSDGSSTAAVVRQDEDAVSPATLLPPLGERGLFELLDNERCAFIESFAIGASNEFPMDDEAYRRTFPTPTKAHWSSPEWRNSIEQPVAPGAPGATASFGFNAILIGTCFTFPEETVPRSSRLVWGTVEAASNVGKSSSCAPQLRFLSFGERDFTGCLSACCAVPKCPNRLALALNGCIVLLKWHATERSFVTENTVPIGSLLISLRPLFLADDTKCGVLVAADWRHSVCAVKVHPIDNSVEIVARDTSLRGVMDLQVIPPNGGGGGRDQQHQHQAQQHHADTPSFLSLPATAHQSGQAPASSTRFGFPEGIVIENPPSVVGYDILFADDMMNLFSVTQEVTEATQRPRTTAAAVAAAAAEEEDDDGGGHIGSGMPLGGNGGGGVPAASPAVGQQKWTARKRLLTVCQTHLGDRVTCIVPGQLSACATAPAEDAISGCGASRFVFGTAHGALGAIAWIAELPARLYELVEQVTADVGQNICGGGFYYSEYREVHALGKLRMATHHLSLSHPQRSKKRNYLGAPVAETTTSPVPYAVDDGRYVTRGVVHLDVVELFLRLPCALQQLVVERVNSELHRDAALGRHGFPARALPHPTNKRAPPALRELFDPATLLSSPEQDDAGSDSRDDAYLKLSEQELDEANETLQRWRLPKLPLTVADLVELVASLERTH